MEMTSSFAPAPLRGIPATSCLSRGALRRHTVGLLGALAVAFSAGPSPASTIPPSGAHNYVITRNGSTIGSATIGFKPSAHGVVVEHSVHVLVKVLIVTVYHYDNNRTETWQDDHLIGLRAHANDNGTIHDVVATQTPNGLEVRGGAGVLQAADTALVGAGWNMLTPGQHPYIDADSGKVSSITVAGPTDETVTIGGRAIKCQVFHITGGVEMTQWFGGDGVLVKERLHARDGSWVETTLQ